MCFSVRQIVQNLRWTSIVLCFSNLAVMVLALTLLCFGFRSCRGHDLFVVAMVVVLTALRITTMVLSAFAQQAAAVAVLGSSRGGISGGSSDTSRIQRRRQYKSWVWWTRCSMVIIALQFLLAMYMIYTVTQNISRDERSGHCILGLIVTSEKWKQDLLVSFLITMCFVTLLQCFTQSDVLRWRSFYSTDDDAWKAHYQEVFDHGIREALCCLGRVKYLGAMEEDEVYSMAQLLGDLVTYRASGTGHLELLAGLALLETKRKLPEFGEGCNTAPKEKILEAKTFHPFAEAAYTGPLLDVGRNPIFFPCMWLHRQGFLFAVWSRRRQPLLHGDNWWRGHATAFTRYANISPGALRHGRVNQAKCEAAYFIVVLHHLKSVVISVRGTETPEDLITDGLCRESSFTAEDLDGLINSDQIDKKLKQHVISSFPHFGHSGIIEAARELFMQIDGSNAVVSHGANGDHDVESASGGFLSSLMRPGCECEGYVVRIVGHSLGGSIAAVLGLRLYRRYLDLHVYSYGPLPCVDTVIAEACSSFITCIVHDSEFSSFLSVNSILRLRAAALSAVSQDKTTDASMKNRLARLVIQVSKGHSKKKGTPLLTKSTEHDNQRDQLINGDTNDQNWQDHPSNMDAEVNSDPDEDSSPLDESQRNYGASPSKISVEEFSNPFASVETPTVDPVTKFMEHVPSAECKAEGDPPEVFLPGLVIHLIRIHRNSDLSHPSVWKDWGAQRKTYKAIVANRESFKDIPISPSMFLDHLPWRCQQALLQVLQEKCENDSEQSLNCMRTLSF